MPQRVERIVVKPGHTHFDACRRLCSSARKLGNQAVYIQRQRIFAKEALLSRSELDKATRQVCSESYQGMPSAASAQRQTQIIHEQFVAWQEARKAYFANPSKYETIPRLPGYSKKYRTFVVGRNGYKIDNGFLFLTSKGAFSFLPLKIRSCEKQPFNAKKEETVIGDVRIVPHGNAFFIELTYKIKDYDPASIALDRSRACLVDVGLRNLVTLAATASGIHPVVVKGGALKSINALYNKDAASLQSHGKSSHRQSKVIKRTCRINNQLHKVSRFVVDFCLQNDLGKIIIGHNEGWKQKINIGKVNNQHFVSIPFNRLIDMIRYKAEEIGIQVIIREESFTSRQSAFDFDPLPTYGEKNAHQVKSSGKRVRGLFIRRNGQKINADVNGCLNIGRKELGDEWLKKLLETDEGCLMQPIAVRIGQRLG
ncbi:IS200/IS605 family element transposase accessory protein TnpB [Sutterella massiliensis]|uniref:IS200/IS605 family element transposase accessory protein TnpB n=1 Tax=Sutterella massiliensis TaxID=1816689 RepID=A0ABS2DSQ0_9BURK|nr:RNA-guided endonuclease TnpB family protein [Sutterella massiliensis]MBM6704319.1 IS200/IS605 family element transposase accessory protein TnpB [Sutterella massiliensis]